MMLRSSSTPLLASPFPSSSSPRHLASDLHPFSSASPDVLRRSHSDENILDSDCLLRRNDTSRCELHVSLDRASFLSAFNRKPIAEEIEEEEEYGDEESNAASAEWFRFVGEFRSCDLGSSAVSPLYLARGLGIDRVGSGLFNADGYLDVFIGENVRSEVEMQYKAKVEEDPSDPQSLRNYAKFLYQEKRDLRKAEEYYSRAILADSENGEALSQYAKIVWELHHDKEWASSYFQQAVRTAPKDSCVLAAYAGFLWETEEDDGDDVGVTYGRAFTPAPLLWI
ncbi:uncharacterized protein LOC121992765 [Zingiber officinale]|uniref:Uncharacterized protein n=1 Tax=Zingiber officinale TaxID=94328 RepID=A0A8J5KU94_ZINOF|nr:uncharacterized protein LOC121992765 [Zingiber officinale]KAG6496179.1 hypothetical protein ZIOFF_044027 [Zingiber officinale]